MEPTEQQRQIIDYDGNSVIIAMPGSGKTAVVSEKVRHYVRSLKAHEGVIAISYTNKASAELRDRCTRNGLDTKNSYFGTIHRFAIGEIVLPFAKYFFNIEPVEVAVRTLKTLEPAVRDTLPWVNRTLEAKDIDEQRLEQLKDLYVNGILLLDTVPVLANLVFAGSVACRNYLKARFKYIFVDEYQDVGGAEHQLFLDITSLGVIGFAVGDVNQSIYAFSGKSSKYLSGLLEGGVFKGFPLTLNHRCHPSIINYSNRFLDPVAPLMPADDMNVFYKKVDGAELETANWIEKCIPRVVEVFRPSCMSSIAVLTKNNNTAGLINQHMMIPRNLSDSTLLDESFLIWSQIFSKLLFYAFSQRQHFVEVINEFSTFESLRFHERKRLRELRPLIKDLFGHEEVDAQGVKNAFLTVAEIIAPKSSSQEAVVQLEELLEQPIMLRTYKPTNPDQVSIMTIHKSKGLEFDVVFHLDLHEWILPSERIEGGERYYPDLEQDLNTHYVGLTRAKTACILITSTWRTNVYGELKHGADSEFLNRAELQALRKSHK